MDHPRIGIQICWITVFWSLIGRGYSSGRLMALPVNRIFIISLKFLDCHTVIYGCCCCCKRKVDWWSSFLLIVLASSARCTTAEGALFLLCYNILPWLSSALCGEMHILGDLDIIWNKKLKKKLLHLGDIWNNYYIG